MNDPLNAGDVCTRSVTFAVPSMVLSEAARLMREHHVGCLVVVDEPSRGERIPIGMLTDRDIVSAVVAKDQDARNLRVGDVMSTDVATVREQESLLDVLGAMRRKGVRRVPVLDAHGSLVGILALDDVLQIVAEEMQAVASAISAGNRHERYLRP